MGTDLFPEGQSTTVRIGPAAIIDEKRKCYAGTVNLEGDGEAGCGIFYNK